MMNLGDGLMFELENGKPKLVLAHCGGSKSSNKMGFCQVTQKNRLQKTAPTPKPGPKEEERWQRDRKCRGTEGVNHAENGSKKTKTKSRMDRCSVIGVDRVQSDSKTKSTNETSNVIKKTIKESLVCLTQEQLQQLLDSIKSSEQKVQDHTSAHIQNGAATKEEEIETVTSEHGRDQQLNSQEKDEETTLSESSPAGLFSTLGEGEQNRDRLKAKKAQWRRELDEQMVLKKQQKEHTDVLAHSEQRRGTQARATSSDQPSGVEEDRLKQNGTEITYNQPSASQTHSNTKALPAAIRSAFVLGEAAPLEQAFSDEKKEQQRRWLQDLEQQREETRLRRKLEKQTQNQAEDHERWAMHFDSFQRRLPAQPPPTGELDIGSSLSHHHAPSQALSTAWEAMSTCGGDSMGRASVDNTQGFQPKTSYLRTMTALLDPAQIEERERKRLKQLEHQRDIEAQVEERRRQKEKEEAALKAMEQEEERRVARESERLQQQYQRDTQLQRQKEELQSRKTQDLYQSMQRASEEAQKDKHLQRIKNLVKKGHDVSNLLQRETTSQALIGQGTESLTTLDTITEAAQKAWKDTAVQTDINPALSPETSRGFQAAVEYKAPPNIKRSKREGRLDEKNGGKENMCIPIKGPDPYEAYARTDRTHEQQQPLRRPEWNTHRPGKAFVPASERYPPALQRNRQENRMRRQMELMTLVERNTISRTAQHAVPPQSENPSHLQRHLYLAQQKDEDSHRVPSASQSRVPSPPVPAVKHRLGLHPPSQAEEQAGSHGWPSSPDYVPYVRTNEVYHLDPLAPISRPTTHEGQRHIRADMNSSRQHTPAVQRDPLLHPELLKSTERQQAILKGLSDLRQGLLLKRRELETSLSPLLQE
ncbi:coiled-coil domain-containing protein 66 [Clarias gariepinus]|uniref:coiled-coil domain-containing protein 66 isoform X1 n=1 Tax=Clarias gariepinus TaxID=13013 RepID=UPI00234D76C3|nr:coiled-coil domain-containing protein 66 isoform X1 [Clarias gariepinus]